VPRVHVIPYHDHFTMKGFIGGKKIQSCFRYKIKAIRGNISLLLSLARVKDVKSALVHKFKRRSHIRADSFKLKDRPLLY
jgi:hypothetical protein